MVEAGSSKIRISSLRSGLKVTSVDLAGIPRYRENVCWYVKSVAKCYVLRNQGGNAELFVPFQTAVWEGTFCIVCYANIRRMRVVLVDSNGLRRTKK